MLYVFSLCLFFCCKKEQTKHEVIVVEKETGITFNNTIRKLGQKSSIDQTCACGLGLSVSDLNYVANDYFESDK